MEPTVSTKSNWTGGKTGLVPNFGLVLLAMFPLSSFAAEVGGGIQVGGTYTDNVFLGPSSSDLDEVIYQATPWLRFAHASPQVDLNAEYTFDWYRYSDLKTTSNFHRGEASVTGRALENSLSAELGARRSQTLSDPNGVIPLGSLPLSGNLIDEDEWWFSPQYGRAIGSAVSLNANYRYSKVQFSDSTAQDSSYHTGNFGLENYNAGQGLTWALRYDWLRSEFQVSAPWENQRATAELGFWVGSGARIFGAGGKESSWDTPFDPAMEDSFWEAGLAYTPSDSLALEFAVGERSFGSSWRGSLDYTFRRGTMSLVYDESPTTTGFDQRGGTTSVLEDDDIDDFLDQPGSAERYIMKRLAWDLSLEFRRTGFGISVFDEDRSDRFNADGTAGADQSQTGVTAFFTWQAGVRTDFVASGSLVEQQTGVGNKSDLAAARLSANYRLGGHSSLSLSYDYSEQEPSGPVSIGRDYVANTVSLLFSYTM